MEECLEDEDITPEVSYLFTTPAITTLQYSPLNQYLSSLNINNNECNIYKTTKKTEKTSFSLNKSHFDERILSFFHFIKQKIYECHLVFILTSALRTNILNEFDEKYLHYLIASMQIHWQYTNEKKSFKSSIIKLICLILFVQIYVQFGGWTMSFSVLTIFLLYIFSLVVYGFVLRRIVGVLFKNLSIISNQSRQVILFVQEILSLNQGYSKLVHLTDNSLYDCSKSFNEEFLENLTNQIFSILFLLHSEMEKMYKIFSKRIKETKSIIDELPWIEDNSETRFEFDINNLNCRQPIGQLKGLHNMIQSQFAELIKMIVLISYFVRNHPDLFLLFDLFKFLRSFRVYHEQLLKCKDLLQIQTKSNLSISNYRENGLNSSSGDKFKTLHNAISRLQIHLYEMSEFSTLLAKRLTKSLSDDSLTSQLQFTDKSKKHVDGIETCWKLLYEELIDIISDNREKVSQTSFRQLKETKATEQIENINEPIVIDNFPEIVDEVIEGIPEDIDNLGENNFSNQDIDTFEERYSTNAKAMLNELQSVIEVRAEDWKKREKLALKRRAAEGKFVFDRELQFNNKLDDFEIGNESHGIVNNATTDPAIDTDEFGLDFRKSLGEMILKQRHTMMINSICHSETEECFGD